MTHVISFHNANQIKLIINTLSVCCLDRKTLDLKWFIHLLIQAASHWLQNWQLYKQILTWRGDSKKQGTIDLERPFCCLLGSQFAWAFLYFEISFWVPNSLWNSYIYTYGRKSLSVKRAKDIVFSCINNTNLYVAGAHMLQKIRQNLSAISSFNRKGYLRMSSDNHNN